MGAVLTKFPGSENGHFGKYLIRDNLKGGFENEKSDGQRQRGNWVFSIALAWCGRLNFQRFRDIGILTKTTEITKMIENLEKFDISRENSRSRGFRPAHRIVRLLVNA